jgi:hypothetical protein
LLLKVAPEAVQLATATFVVVIGVGQVVLTYELPATGSAAMHDAAGPLVTTGGGQVIVM